VTGPGAINVLDPKFYVDPWQAYRWLRDEAPVYWDPVQQVWAISRYDDVRDIEKDTGRYSSCDGSRPHVDQMSPDGPPHVMHPGMPPVIQDFATTTTELIKARQAEPRDDLISVWAHARGWSIKHILEETILLLDGGAETTRTVIGSMIRELALQPDQRRILLERPGLLATTAVEEFIRWVSPILNMRRTATVDHELHGQQIRAGDEIMFEELLRRIPDWELADPGEPQIVPATFTRGYDRIRICFTPERGTTARSA
jgi:cytochrome P450